MVFVQFYPFRRPYLPKLAYSCIKSHWKLLCSIPELIQINTFRHSITPTPAFLGSLVSLFWPHISACVFLLVALINDQVWICSPYFDIVSLAGSYVWYLPSGFMQPEAFEWRLFLLHSPLGHSRVDKILLPLVELRATIIFTSGHSWSGIIFHFQSTRCCFTHLFRDSWSLSTATLFILTLYVCWI